METAANKFHERYEGVTFQDDLPWYIWNDAWRACIEHCALELERHALNDDSKDAFFKLANELREAHEDHKQTRPARDNRQRSEEADIF